ncbi:MAG: cation:proton antiporter [Candidatus Nanopelagicales bacterium]
MRIPLSAATEALPLIEIGGALLLLGLVAYGAARIGVSAVPFFLITGLAFGNGGFVEIQVSEDFFNIGAQIGALLLLLLLGLEYSAREISTALKERLPAGLIDLLNAIPGVVLAIILGWPLVGVIAMGGITYVSSSGIAAQLIRDSGWARSEVARRTISILVLEDLILAPYLPLVTALALGIGVVGGAISVGVAIAITGIVLLLGVRNERFFSRVLNSREPNALLLTVFGLALFAAGVATLIGFSGAVAAFLVGLLLTGEVAEAVRIRLAPLRDLFAALFFLFFGLATNPLDILSTLPYVIPLVVFTVITKFITGRFIGKGLSDPMSWLRISAFLVPRGEFSIVIAGLLAGLSFSTELQAITASYVILTTVVGSFLVLLFQSQLARRAS